MTYKSSNEFLPYHPSASHINPDYREGWNACYQAAIPAIEDSARYRAFFNAGLPITFLGEEYHDKPSLDAAIDAARKAEGTEQAS